MLLVRVKTPSTTPIAATITASGAATSSIESSATEAAATTSPIHTRDVGSLGRDLDVAALEDALVQYERLGDEAGLRKLNVGVSVMTSVLATRGRGNVAYPFG